MRIFYRTFLLALIVIAAVLSPSGKTFAQAFSSVVPLSAVSISGTAVTGEKPQSKTWHYDGKWWAVFPTNGNTYLWRLDGTNWTNILLLAAGNAHADCKVVDNITHVLLYKGVSSELLSLEYVAANSIYKLWTTRPASVPVSLDASVETATIDVDNTGRMWLASDGSTTINVRWSESPYSTWSSPVTVASGINSDDIGAVICLPGKTGVFWSNQSSSIKRFGFKTINTGADPSVSTNWSADEVPATQSAVDFGAGMADDHINMSVASDGTLYCAVKTSYDNSSYPRIALLVRRPAGTWDNLYQVPTSGGTRPIVILNETAGKVKVVYTTSEGSGNIAYRESSTASIVFGAENILLSGSYNNATSSKQNYTSDIVILASSSSQVVGVLASDNEVAPPSESLVGHWKMDEASGTTSIIDASTYGNNGTVLGSAARVIGKNGNALSLTTSSDYATVPDHASLDITSQITIAAWIRPTTTGTQYVIKKGLQGGTSGYELSLSNDGLVFFRFNQNANFRVNSVTSFPTDGTTWMHVAATYNGSALKIYINGVLEATTTPANPAPIVANNLALAIGAQSDGTTKFKGAIDDAMIFNSALGAAEIAELMSTDLSVPKLTAPENNATGVAVSPVLTWNPVAGATSYSVQVSAAADFTNPVYDESDIAETNVTLPALLNNTIYYWRVNAMIESEISDWSGVFTFTTAEAIAPVINRGPGYALNFDGTDDYVSVPDHNSLDLTNALTIEAWIKPEALTTQRLITKAVNQTMDGYELSLSAAGASADQKFFVRFNQQTTGDDNRVNSVTKYETGKWYHIAATYDGSIINLYVNGVLEASKTSGITINQNNNSLRFGSQVTGTAYPFTGSLDEIRIWNVARSASDIRASMTEKLTGNEPGLAGYWSFNEENGSLVSDLSANGNDGILNNMNIISRPWSGAALGDASSNDYNETGGYAASLAHPQGDEITVTGTSGTITGIQVYRVDDLPIRDGSVLPSDWTAFPLRYWGVKIAGTNTPTYTLVYNYDGHPDIVDERLLKLVKRTDHADNNWVDAEAILDMVNKTLTVTGATGTEYAFSSSNSTLPVTFGLLSGKMVDNKAILSWETQTESNNSGFFIERSKDGVQFSNIGFVATQANGGNSASRLSYGFTDQQPFKGNNYYRLKQVDFDGANKYSPIIIISNNSSSAAIDKIYPNPVVSDINFSVISPVASAVVYTIYDMSGKITVRFTGNISEGNNIVKINPGRLKQGKYILKMIISKTGDTAIKPFIFK